MKFLPVALCALLLLIQSVPADAQTVAEIYSEAQRAYLAGDINTAKAKFQTVLAVNPKHQPSINYLRLIASREAQDGGAKERQQLLDSLILPEISFRDTTLGSALDFIAQVANKQTDGKANVNFVRRLPDGYEDQTKITLKLSNTPLTTVLRYVGQLGGVKFEIDPYAIVVKLTEEPAAVPAEDAAAADSLQ